MSTKTPIKSLSFTTFCLWTRSLSDNTEPQMKTLRWRRKLTCCFKHISCLVKPKHLLCLCWILETWCRQSNTCCSQMWVRVLLTLNAVVGSGAVRPWQWDRCYMISWMRGGDRWEWHWAQNDTETMRPEHHCSTLTAELQVKSRTCEAKEETWGLLLNLCTLSGREDHF